VVVTVTPPSSTKGAPAANRTPKYAQRLSVFSDFIESKVQIASHIESAGGAIVGNVWIGPTIRARLTGDQAVEVATDGRVSRIDSPGW
jgi:hypothetical protein